MSVDISKIKPGDKITLGATVENIGGQAASLLVSIDGVRIGVLASEVVSHTPRELDVGEDCKDASTGQIVAVLARAGGLAWVRGPTGWPYTANLSDLERIP